tara:strand:+ start:535 stop:861 length:327 start_codon:yes stop_codon:yes gene_type:complete
MAQLHTKIKLYLEANSKTWDAEKENISLIKEGLDSSIHTWNVSGLAKPTAEQIASYETAANTAESNAIIIATRKTSYGVWQDQLDEIFTDIDAWKTRIAKVKTDNPQG